MATDLTVGDRVKFMPHVGIIGTVVSVQLRRVRLFDVESSSMVFTPRMMVTVRLEVHGMYGEYADLPLDDLVRV